MAAYAALASLVQTAVNTTNHTKFHFSTNAKEKIVSIHEYAIFLLSFLEDYPERASRWEGKLRELAHEAEDIIEQFMWKLSFYEREKISSLKFEEELRNVMEKLCLIAGDVMEERPAYSSLSLSSAAASRVAATGNGVAIGLNEDVTAIKDRLCGLSSKLEVVPILGMGGIGKTTLARTVYDDSVIMYHFDIRVWLTISQDYSAQKVLVCLVNSMKLIDEHVSRIGMDDVSILAEKVYKNLKGRRYLVVMDDVWSTKVWDDVRNVFPDDANGSRIMLTTRLADVAVYPNCTSAPHEMRFMNDSQSWDLLKGKVFANSDCPPELEDVGKTIAKSCGGLPLAVVLVAGFLSEVNKNPSSWEEISKNVNPIVGQELEGILSLSYTHLSHHLRPCFLFMAMFPEDENISASRLIRLWLACRFLKHQNGCSKSLEEEAEEYLEDLVKRNLVTVSSKKSDGKIKCCGLHDMVRDLCIRKAHDEKFIRVLDDRAIGQGVTTERHTSFMNEQHITFGRSHMNSIWAPTTRTILYLYLPNFPYATFYLRCHRLLRVLDAESENSVSLPLEVFELFHLRYLALTCSSIPSAISNLMNLQTLTFLPTSWIASANHNHRRNWMGEANPLPLEIWRMPQLRHVLLHHAVTLPHPPDGSNPPLENLQTLSYILNLVWNENVLLMIPNIKRLGLVYDIDAEFNLDLLRRLDKLEKLEIDAGYAYEIRGLDKLGKLEIDAGYKNFWRNSLNFPSPLKKLTLVGWGLPWKDMSVIGSLPNLQVLKLRNYACRGETWETVDGEFPDPRYLLTDRSMLQQWITESSHFPKLKCLVLCRCRMLREIPGCIGEIPTLELIEVDSINQFLVESAKQIKEDQESYGNYDLHVRVTRSHQSKDGLTFQESEGESASVIQNLAPTNSPTPSP